MYGCYCNSNMNWLLGIGMLFNAMGSMFSQGRRAYPSYTANEVPSYTYSNTPVFTSDPEVNHNLVGETLSGINTRSTIPDISSEPSLWNIANPVPQPATCYLVGDILSKPYSSAPAGYMPSFPPYSGIEDSYGLLPYNPLLSACPQAIQLGENLVNNVSETYQVQDAYSSAVSNDLSISRTSAKVTPSREVINRVKQIAQKVNCDYKDLLGLIFCESSFRTVPSNWNGKSAVGLIQFTDICIKDLNQRYGKNYSKSQIAKMSAMQQLDLVELSLLRAKELAGFSASHKLSSGELYAINLIPRNAKKDIVSVRGDKYYSGNAGLDLDHDGKITKAELAKKVNSGTLSVVC